jgi:amidase
LHEIFFDAAIKDAEKLDDYLEKNGKPVGPLHGLPVSLKDQFHVKGVETTMGYVGWLGTFEGQKGTGKEKVFESLLVRELRELGAVLYVKTSVPQTLVSGETFNNFIGYTNNPKNRLLAAGGSSGGEGALIALKGSPLGFGTDIAGSVRMPASANGIYGLKPSTSRISSEGIATSMDGQNTVLATVGPLATSARSMRLVMRGLLSTKPWLHDPLVVEIPFRDEIEKETRELAEGQLVFGIMAHDGTVTPHPPVARAIEIARFTIEKMGHKVIEWTPPAHSRATAIMVNPVLFNSYPAKPLTILAQHSPLRRRY